MNGAPLQRRMAIADGVRRVRELVVDRITDECLGEHPGLDDPVDLLRLGLRSHVENLVSFVCGAVLGGGPPAFANSVRWTARVLEARGFSPQVFAQCIQALPEALAELAPSANEPLLAEIAGAGVAAARDDGVAVPRALLPQAAATYVQAAVDGSRRAALAIVDEERRRGASLLEVYTGVLEPALVQIGRMWELNWISPADEHMATAITQQVLAHLYEGVEVEPHRGNVVITGACHETHQLGAHMVADALELDGWAVRFLGSDVPPDAVLTAAIAHGADIVGISVTMSFHLSEVARLIALLRERVGRHLRVVVGGAAFRDLPTLADEIGAEGSATDLAGALALLRGQKGNSSSSPADSSVDDPLSPAPSGETT